MCRGKAVRASSSLRWRRRQQGSGQQRLCKGDCRAIGRASICGESSGTNCIAIDEPEPELGCDGGGGGALGGDEHEEGGEQGPWESSWKDELSDDDDEYNEG